MQKVSIIIPIFNEARTCIELLQRVVQKKIPGVEKEIIVVESNSTDGTRALVQEFAAKNPLKLILQPAPRGKGFALREGFAAATGDIILIQDADLEYDIDDYDKVLAPVLSEQTQFVLGSRHLGAQSWRIRAFRSYPGTVLVMNAAHTVFTTIFNVLYGQKTTDPATMFKVFRRRCLEGLEFRCDRFDFDFELACKLVLAGFTPLEVPVKYESRGFAAGKKVRFFRDPITWMRILLLTRIQHDKARVIHFICRSAETKRS